MPTKKTIYLIGGAPLTGKTFLAKRLSKKLSIPWISTDFIRGWMRSLISEKNSPELFKITKYSAESYHKKFTLSNKIKNERKRDECVFKAIRSFIEKNEYNELWGSFIIEGISLHPDLIKKFLKKYNLKIVFLIDENKERIRKLIYKRGLWDDAETYADWVKDIEVDYLIKTNEYYLKEAKKYKFKFFVIKDNLKKKLKEVEKFLVS